MAAKPLEIHISDRDRPLAEQDISGRGGGGEEHQEERSGVRNLTDHELREKIERMKSKMNVDFLSKLPDKGEKLRALMCELEEERERRERDARTQKEDVKECERKTVSISLESAKKFCSESLFGPFSRSSFTSSFNKKLGTKADNETCTQASEKCSSGTPNSRSLGHRTCNSGAELNSRVPSRSSSSKLNSITDSANQKSPGNDQKEVASSSYPELHEEGNISSRVSKRRRALIIREPQQLEWVQVKDVVLLDDEDVLPVQPIEEGQNVDKWKEAKIYYPSRDHLEFVEICYWDIQCLDPESYLTSTIMNFYMQYLQNPVSQIGSTSEYHFFNTYFYKKLEKAVSSKVDKNVNFSKLRRWLKGVNIFQKAYIFLPIHGDLHWSLVIICIPAKEDQSGPIILHLDSLGFHASNSIFDNIESYLTEEWKHIYQNTSPADVPISKRIWDYLPRHIKRKKIMVPQQKNEYDCGLFVLYFMEKFIEKAPDRLKSKDLAKFGKKWFQPEEASGLRKRLRELLLKEFKSAKLVNNREESPESSVSSQELGVEHDEALS